MAYDQRLADAERERDAALARAEKAERERDEAERWASDKEVCIAERDRLRGLPDRLLSSLSRSTSTVDAIWLMAWLRREIAAARAPESPAKALGALLTKAGAVVCVCHVCRHQDSYGPCSLCKCRNAARAPEVK